MKLVTVPHPLLAQPAKPVRRFDQKLLVLVKQMKIILNQQTNPPGVGLAGPQVGIPFQLFLMKPTKKSAISVFINPKVIEIKDKSLDIRDKKLDIDKEFRSLQSYNLKSNKLEGCLSIPKIWGPVNRRKSLTLEYQELDGARNQKQFACFEAVIIQHEMDHLNGVLFTQRVLEQKGQLYEEENGELIKFQS